jgi:hypothetical protein
MKKYYIEFVFEGNDYINHYDLQSKWFDTEEQAIEWTKTFDYVSENVVMYLMSALWDEVEGFYGDIKQERRVM